MVTPDADAARDEARLVVPLAVLLTVASFAGASRPALAAELGMLCVTAIAWRRRRPASTACGVLFVTWLGLGLAGLGPQQVTLALAFAGYGVFAARVRWLRDARPGGGALTAGSCFARYSPMRPLEGQVAVVTGGTFGVGRWVAGALARDGMRVFVTGRSAADGETLDDTGRIIGIRCDHRVDAETASAFERVGRAAAGIDVLVNSVWGGYERMVEDGEFT